MGVTVVTGIWDIKRSELSDGWNRSYVHYLDNLKKLMKTEDNMIIFIESKYKEFVENNRSKHNTYIIVKELEWFKSNEDIYYNIQKIRSKLEWRNQSGWLPDSTQAKLEMYNPIVMSKMFLLNDASIMDPFDSTHLVWIDGGITNTVHEGYFWKDNVVKKLDRYFDKFSFVCFPYDGKVEIHGFEYSAICTYSDAEVNMVARGGIFGGPKKSIKEINGIYYSLLYETLNQGLMGTEESVFTIMTYKYPELVQYYEIENNGLLVKFFEDLKNDALIKKTKLSQKNKVDSNSSVALYVLTYNSPKQLEKLCISMEEYDSYMLKNTKKYLINNSINSELFKEYDDLCEKYDFEEIHKDNIGICGGRQFIAEHAEQHEFDYYMFFEDDMFFYLGEDQFCKNGFIRKIDNLLHKTIGIMKKDELDFLKWNFTEFYGDNSKQWAWYNVPQDFREKHFPDKPKKSQNDYGKEPYAKYTNIKSHLGLPYATGEVYYCNWPQTVSREGNKKMFLDTTWAHPYEQTWMSYIYQETIKGNIIPGILLATPTEHDRFEFYPKEERREN